MVTREERDYALEILTTISKNTAYLTAKEVFLEFFLRDTGRVIQLVQPMWENRDFLLIRDTLASWFS